MSTSTQKTLRNYNLLRLEFLELGDALDRLIRFVEKHGPKHRKRRRARHRILFTPFIYELDEPWASAVRKAKRASEGGRGK